MCFLANKQKFLAVIIIMKASNEQRNKYILGCWFNFIFANARNILSKTEKKRKQDSYRGCYFCATIDHVDFFFWTEITLCKNIFSFFFGKILSAFKISQIFSIAYFIYRWSVMMSTLKYNCMLFISENVL